MSRLEIDHRASLLWMTHTKYMHESHISESFEAEDVSNGAATTFYHQNSVSNDNSHCKAFDAS